MSLTASQMKGPSGVPCFTPHWACGCGGAPVDDARRTDPHDQGGRRRHAHHREPPRNALLNLRGYAKAEALSGVTLENQRRVHGRDHRKTLVTSSYLSRSLSEQGKYAAEIEREVLVQMTRLLGAEHENALISPSNIARTLSQCGQKTET